ncbi:hypothetical protein SLI_6667 [Streptomyces lividans 1326]|uniref:Uncharacterized protein n=1 Tax=Streptomyces lividans 1326 TaxID=1200984 RepID=A0A7U9HE04_STRLI|nr:hypothetical protein SLI_6667 [Streptomyces lividans 1326]
MDRAPVDVGAADERGGDRGEQRPGLGAPGAQRGGGVGERAEDRVRADLQEDRRAELAQGAYGVGEAHGVPDLVRPVAGGAQVVARGESAGEGGDDGYPRGVVGEFLGDLVELLEHAVHEGRVEGVRDGEALGPAPGFGKPCRHVLRRVRLARDHHRGGPVDRREGQACLQSLQVGEDLLLGGLDGDHGAVGGQRLHQPGPGRDQPRRVVEGQHAGDVGGGQLADRVSGEEAGPHAPGLQQPEERHLDREQRRLGATGLVQALSGGDDLPQGLLQHRVEPLGHGVEGVREHGVRGVEFLAHARSLRPLPGEQQGGGTGLAAAPYDPGARPALGQRPHTVQQGRAVGADHDRAVFEDRTVRRQRVPGVARVGRVLGAGELGEPRGLSAQRLLGVGGDHPGERGGGRGAGEGVRLRGREGRLANDDVRVGAAHAERADAGHQRTVRTRPGGELALNLQTQFGQRDRRVGGPEVQAGGKFPVGDGEQRLDQARHAGGALQVPDVGLDRADPQRAVRVAALRAEGGAERGGLDRVADRGAGAVQFDVLDPLARAEGGAPVRLADQLLLRGAAGHGEPVGGAVVVDRRAADHAMDPVAVREGGRQRLEHHHAAALAGHEAVGTGVEGVRDTVGGQCAETFLRSGVLGQQIEVHTGHHSRRRLPAAQALARQVHGDQRRRLRRVHRETRTAQPQVVRDPPRDDAPVHPGHRVLGDRLVPVLVQQVGVVVAQGAHEHRGPAAAQRRRYDRGVLQRLPRQFEHEPLLRVHRGGLTRRDAEESGVEPVDTVQERPAPAPGARAGRRVRGHVPAARRHLGHGVGTAVQQLPERRGVRGPGEPAGQSHDSDPLHLPGVRPGCYGIVLTGDHARLPFPGCVVRTSARENARGRDPNPLPDLASNVTKD